MIDKRFGIRGKAHGQNGTVRGYPLPAVQLQSTDNLLFKPRRERCNDALDKCRELMNRFEQRLTLDNLRFIQRYTESKLHFLVHFRIGKIPHEFVALLQWKKDIGDSKERADIRNLNTRETLPHQAGAVRSKINTLKH